MPPIALSKADCLKYFWAKGCPNTSALLGVYRWDADFNNARFNVETAFDPIASACWMRMTKRVWSQAWCAATRCTFWTPPSHPATVNSRLRAFSHDCFLTKGLLWGVDRPTSSCSYGCPPPSPMLPGLDGAFLTSEGISHRFLATLATHPVRLDSRWESSLSIFCCSCYTQLCIP